MADLDPWIFDMRPWLALCGALVLALPAAAGEPALRLEIASYNVQFAMPDLPLLEPMLRDLPGQKPNVELRARAIGAALACFDVVALQETINDRRRTELLEQLEADGSTCGKPSRLPDGRMFQIIAGPDLPDGSSWLPLLDDELALASRLPIVSADRHVYAASAGADALAAKGVLHARLALDQGSNDALDVFTTHLQADTARAPVRKRQIEELAAFVARRARGPGPVLVMGDFNIWGGGIDRADSKSEYNALLAALNSAVAPRRFVDLWLATHPDDPERDSGTKPRVLEDGSIRPREKRIDFGLLAGADRASPLAMRRDFLPSALVIEGAPLGDLSNHAALMAEIGWRRRPAALTAEAFERQPRP